MGWATYLWTDITYNRQTYNSKSEVYSSLDEENNMIKYLEQKLKDLAVMTEPKKFCPEEDDPLAWVMNSVKETLEELEESYIERFKLDLLLENWDKCHNEEGYAIERPENVSWDASYLEGDFIEHGKEEEEDKE